MAIMTHSVTHSYSRSVSRSVPGLVHRGERALSRISSERSVSDRISDISDGKGSWRRLRDLVSPFVQLKVARAVRKGGPVVLGSRPAPFETLTDRHALLDLLPEDRSLVVRLRCHGREILGDLPRLIRLDRRHDLSVDWWLDRPRRLGWTRSALEGAGRLAAEGIRVRLVWRAAVKWDAADLEAWAAAAKEHRIWDLSCETDSPELARHFEMLRLEYGFPMSFAGRG